jgi:hypothetical protein
VPNAAFAENFARFALKRNERQDITKDELSLKGAYCVREEMSQIGLLNLAWGLQIRISQR